MLLGPDRHRVGYGQPEHPHGSTAGDPSRAHDHGRCGESLLFLGVVSYDDIVCHAQTIVAWVMVLVRLHYFREHIIARERKKTVLQSMRDRVSKIVTGVSHSVPLWHVEAGEKHAHHGSHAIEASDGIGAALAGGATTGLGLGIALGNADSTEGGQTTDENKDRALTSDSSSHIHIQIDSPMRASPSEDPTMFNNEAEERGIIADAQSFTSSPRSGAIPLQSPTSMQSGHVQFQFPSYQGIGDVGTIRRRPGGA